MRDDHPPPSSDPVEAGALAACRAEAGALAAAMLSVPPGDWDRPTVCTPWTVAELLGHVLTGLNRLPDMLSAPEPAGGTITGPAGYFRADHRFSARANAERVEAGQARAAGFGDGHAIAVAFDRAWPEVLDRCAREPAGRLVRTRHGDVMRLTAFLATRLVELGIHGLDLAAALDRPAWLTVPAATALTDLMLDSPGTALAALGWDGVTFLRKATGRAPLTDDEARTVDRQGIRWLALG